MYGSGKILSFFNYHSVLNKFNLYMVLFFWSSAALLFPTGVQLKTPYLSNNKKLTKTRAGFSTSQQKLRIYPTEKTDKAWCKFFDIPVKTRQISRDSPP
jgi:hypothetical protein